MELAVGGLAAIAVYSILRAVRRRDPVVAERVVTLAGPVRRAGPRNPLAPAADLLGRLGKRAPGDREALSRLATSAGSSLSVDVILGARVILGLTGLLMGLQAGSLAPAIALAAAAGGYQLPVLWLKAKVEARREEVAATLPDAVDLLAVCTRAGLNIPLALERVASRFSGVLGDEMERAVAEIQLGSPRSGALGSMAERLAVDEAEALVGVLTHADRYGVAIATSLDNFSTDLRRRRRRKAEEAARKAPVKILFPLVFLILPAFVLLTVVPLLLGTFRSLGL